MDKPKCWVKKNATKKKIQLKVKVEVGLKLHFEFVHILPKFGFEQPSIV